MKREVQIQFEGIVTQVLQHSFWAKMRELSLNGVQSEEFDEFDMEHVPESDRELVQPGAIFYWTISKQTKKGTIRAVSEFYFRRHRDDMPESVKQFVCDRARLSVAEPVL